MMHLLKETTPSSAMSWTLRRAWSFQIKRRKVNINSELSNQFGQTISHWAKKNETEINSSQFESCILFISLQHELGAILFCILPHRCPVWFLIRKCRLLKSCVVQVSRYHERTFESLNSFVSANIELQQRKLNKKREYSFILIQQQII